MLKPVVDFPLENLILAESKQFRTSQLTRSGGTLVVMHRNIMQNEKISNKNGNWYIAEIIEKCEPINRNEDKELRRVITYGNHHLIKAEDPKSAYKKAVKIGKEAEFKFVNSDKIEMEWIFVGIGELIPIYDENIEDGCEVMWTDYGFISNRKTIRFARTEKELLEKIKPKSNL